MTRERLEELKSWQWGSMSNAEFEELLALARRGLEAEALQEQAEEWTSAAIALGVGITQPSDELRALVAARDERDALRRACELAREYKRLKSCPVPVAEWDAHEDKVNEVERAFDAALAAVGMPVEK